MRKTLFVTVSILFLTLTANAQEAPDIQWQKCLGGSNDEWAYHISQTTDGGYIVAGETSSNDSDVSGNHGNYDMWVVKLDDSGNIQWQKCFGGSGSEGAKFVQQTADGGYIVAGYTDFNDGDVSGNHDTISSYSDMWVVKLDGSGNIQWQKCLGGSNEDRASSIQQTTDGGYIVAGYASSNDGDVSGWHNGTNNYGYPTYDMWVVKLDDSGNIQWQKCLGGSSSDVAYSIQQTADGGYIVAGKINSNDGDVSGWHNGTDEDGNSTYDMWVVKLDGNGNIQWQKCLGGSNNEWAYHISQTTDGGYIVVGDTYSNDGDVSGWHSGTDNYGNSTSDMWVVKLDGSGNIQWQKCVGGNNYDAAISIEQTSDGRYIVAGYTYSNNGDVSGNHDTTGNYSDVWLVKLSSNGDTVWTKCIGGSLWDYAYSIQQTNDGGYIMAGYTRSNDGDVSGYHDTISSYSDIWVVKLNHTNVSIPLINSSGSKLLSIYPNPMQNYCRISFYNPSGEAYRLEITDMSGRTVFAKEGSGDNVVFERNNLKSGAYNVKVVTKEAVYTAKLVVE